MEPSDNGGSAPQQRPQVARSDANSATSPWCHAVVTGASSGMGAAFADQLAAQGVRLTLVGRDSKALEDVAIRARNKGSLVEVLVADLALDSGLARVAEVIGSAQPMVDLLVNNAGLGKVGPFVDLSPSDALYCMRVNNEALVVLTQVSLGRMIAVGRGCVIQVSSGASLWPGPHNAVYVATKTFVTSFGRSLSEELAGTGVSCTTVLPGYVRTNWFKRAGLEPDIPEKQWRSANEVVLQSLNAARDGRPMMIPGRSIGKPVALSKVFPGIGGGTVGRRLAKARQFVQRVAWVIVR